MRYPECCQLDIRRPNKIDIPRLGSSRSLSSLSLGSSSLGGSGRSGALSRLLLLCGFPGGTGGLTIATVGRCPQGEVVTEKLHDESAIAVGLLGQRVKLGNGVIEGLLCEVAGAVGRVEDLVVEDGEVERQAETDWVGGSKLSLSDVGSVLFRVSLIHPGSACRNYLVGFMGSSGSSLALITRGKLGEVAVIVTLPIVCD
jgi:hypothetical protein